jgi:hypothetical protein
MRCNLFLLLDKNRGSEIITCTYFPVKEGLFWKGERFGPTTSSKIQDWFFFCWCPKGGIGRMRRGEEEAIQLGNDWIGERITGPVKKAEGGLSHIHTHR